MPPGCDILKYTLYYGTICTCTKEKARIFYKIACMQTIDILTPQNVRIEYELGSLRERAFAFALDTMLLGAGYALFLMLIIMGFSLLVTDADSTFVLMVLFAFGPLAAFFLYHFLFELLTAGQTPGKKVMKLCVIRLDARPPRASDYALRAAFHLVETVPCSGILAAVGISATPYRQRLGDRAAHTVVVRRENLIRFSLQDIVERVDQDGYTPLYPQVLALGERDMLSVKITLNRYLLYPNPAHEEVLETLCGRLCTLLHLPEPPADPITFLKTLLKDYIALTR